MKKTPLAAKRRLYGLCGLAAPALLLASLAKPAAAEVIWKGDFETGDLSQWTRKQAVAEDRLTVVSDPVAQGKFALRAKVVPGDDPINASGNRNEVLRSNLDGEGDERFYKWSTMWPDDYQTADTWQLFTQFHHEGLNGSPPVEMFVRGESVVLRVSGEDMWTTQLERGAWHDFVLHARWSADAQKGFVELWYDGAKVLKKTAAQTLPPGDKVYLKQGLYRSESITVPQVVYHDGMTIATTEADVLPPEGQRVSAASSTNGSEEIMLRQPGAGGGCSTASTMATWPVALLGVGLFFYRRRRRNRPVLAMAQCEPGLTSPWSTIRGA